MQVAAAKVAVDMETDKEGNLTTQQRQSYQASMRHEHQIYERLAGRQNGIPAVYFAGVCQILDKLISTGRVWSVLTPAPAGISLDNGPAGTHPLPVAACMPCSARQ